MSWLVDELAEPMGYEYCVLFDCARDAIAAYPEQIFLPENICPSVAPYSKYFLAVDQQTGLADLPVHLYGYQASNVQNEKIALDPLMTGWVRHLKTQSAIVSFGHKKMLSVGYGGAFLTNDEVLAEEMGEKGHWNEYYTQPLMRAIDGFYEDMERRWEVVHLWDRFLGDSLTRIPAEQLMPWRVMRRAESYVVRRLIVYELRKAGIDVGTNYGPLSGRNEWGDTVLNFFCSPDIDRAEIQRACGFVKRAVDHG